MGRGGGKAMQEPTMLRRMRTVVPLVKGSYPEATNVEREEGCAHPQG